MLLLWGATIGGLLSGIGAWASRFWTGRDARGPQLAVPVGIGVVGGALLGALGGEWTAVAAAGALLAALLTLLLISRHTTKIPNAILLTAAGLRIALGLLGPASQWPGAIGGAVVGAGLLLLLELSSRGALGMGTVKLGAVIGLSLGWPGTPLALLLTALGALVSLLVLRLRGKGAPEVVPTVPFLAGVALVVLPLLSSLPGGSLARDLGGGVLLVTVVLAAALLRWHQRLPKATAAGSLPTFVLQAAAPAGQLLAIFTEVQGTGRLYLCRPGPEHTAGALLDGMQVYGGLRSPVERSSIALHWAPDGRRAGLLVGGACWACFDLESRRKQAAARSSDGAVVPLDPEVLEHGLAPEAGYHLLLLGVQAPDLAFAPPAPPVAAPRQGRRLLLAAVALLALVALPAAGLWSAEQLRGVRLALGPGSGGAPGVYLPGDIVRLAVEVSGYQQGQPVTVNWLQGTSVIARRSVPRGGGRMLFTIGPEHPLTAGEYSVQVVIGNRTALSRPFQVKPAPSARA